MSIDHSALLAMTFLSVSSSLEFQFNFLNDRRNSHTEWNSILIELINNPIITTSIEKVIMQPLYPHLFSLTLQLNGKSPCTVSLEIESAGLEYGRCYDFISIVLSVL